MAFNMPGIVDVFRPTMARSPYQMTSPTFSNTGQGPTPIVGDGNVGEGFPGIPGQDNSQRPFPNFPWDVLGEQGGPGTRPNTTQRPTPGFRPPGSLPRPNELPSNARPKTSTGGPGPQGHKPGIFKPQIQPHIPKTQGPGPQGHKPDIFKPQIPQTPQLNTPGQDSMARYQMLGYDRFIPIGSSSIFGG